MPKPTIAHSRTAVGRPSPYRLFPVVPANSRVRNNRKFHNRSEPIVLTAARLCSTGRPTLLRGLFVFVSQYFYHLTRSFESNGSAYQLPRSFRRAELSGTLPSFMPRSVWTRRSGGCIQAHTTFILGDASITLYTFFAMIIGVFFSLQRRWWWRWSYWELPWRIATICG